MPLLLFAPAPVADGPELVARGGVTSEPSVGLRAFCLRPGAGDGALRGLEARGRCATGELLKLVYGNPGGRPELFLVGVDGRFAIKWYEPRPPSTVSVPAAKGAELPLPGAIRLGVNHQPGPLRIFALVGEAPIAAREIEGAVEELRRRRLDLAEVETLPLPDRDDVAQRSLLIEVTAGLP